MRRVLLAVMAAASVSACVSTQELPLAENVVRLDTQAGGALFVGSATNVTMKRAAEATIARGYTHFRLADAQMAQGTQYLGQSSYGTGTATWTPTGGYATGYGYSVPVYAPTASVGVTVVMFRAGEPAARGAFDAAAIIKQFGG